MEILLPIALGAVLGPLLAFGIGMLARARIREWRSRDRPVEVDQPAYGAPAPASEQVVLADEPAVPPVARGVRRGAPVRGVASGSGGSRLGSRRMRVVPGGAAAARVDEEAVAAEPSWAPDPVDRDDAGLGAPVRIDYWRSGGTTECPECEESRAHGANFCKRCGRPLA